MIKVLEFDWPSNIKNIVLYSFFSILASSIKEFCTKNINNTTILQAMLIYFADKEISDRFSSFFAFTSILIVIFANFSQL